MDENVVPRIADFERETRAGTYPPTFIEQLKEQARAGGLWNLFLPALRDSEPGTRLSNFEYAPLTRAASSSRRSGQRSPCAPAQSRKMLRKISSAAKA